MSAAAETPAATAAVRIATKTLWCPRQLRQDLLFRNGFAETAKMVSPKQHRPVVPLRGRPTIFGNVYEKNVIFLLDTSGSMYPNLDVVKEHLIEVLFFRATSGRDTMFNIIEFSEDVNRWGDRLVPCTPRTVSLAGEWIHKLRCRTSTNTMEALFQAYEDDGMDAIYLVTDGLPDQRPAVVLENVRRLHKGRPIHCVYLTGTHADPAAVEFLEDLARETQGSLHTISLSLYGRIQKVNPVFNQKTEFVRHYDGEFVISPNIRPELSQSSSEVKKSVSFEQIPTRPTSAPLSRSPGMIYNTDSQVAVLKAPHGLVPIPYVSSKFFQPRARGSSRILDYADALIASRGLKGLESSANQPVPVAASIMKGKKVLARKDSDGLYYMATVTEQSDNEKFAVEFHKCPALRKPSVQDTALHDMVSYEDAVRHHVCLGDKVLAPWQPDGRYGPGTVLDGVDRRDPRSIGSPDGGGALIVAFYNGETIELEPGVAVRIPLSVFDRIATEVQLPESQRRKIHLSTDTTTPPYDIKPPHVTRTWQRPFSPPSRRDAHDPSRDRRAKEHLSAKIESQLKRNEHLLERSRLRGFSDEESSSSGEDFRDEYCAHFERQPLGRVHVEDLKGREKRAETFDVGTDTHHDLSKYVDHVIPVGTPLSKAGGKPEEKRRWRSWSSGVAPRAPRFRDTLLSKAPEVGKEDTVRPQCQEYQSVAGVSFPAGTDRKFAGAPQNETWHPYRQWEDKEQRAPNTRSSLQLRHHEYQSSKGVPFPSAADRKFNTDPNPNWSPDHAGQPAPRSSNWEDGLGHGDAAKNKRDEQRLERRRDATARYHAQIRKNATDKEEKESGRHEQHRRNIEERNRKIAEQMAEKTKQSSDRVEFRRKQAESICQKEKDRQDKAEEWKHSRVEALKTRRVQHEEVERSFEKAAQEQQANRENGLRAREQKRVDSHHERLVNERQEEQGREARLRSQEHARQATRDKIKTDAERKKEMRIHVKQQKEQTYRASILP